MNEETAPRGEEPPAAPSPATESTGAPQDESGPGRVLARLHRGEDVVALVVLAAMVALPLAEAVARTFFSRGVPGAIPFVQHLTLWIGFLGAALAAREGRLLSLATGNFVPAGLKRWSDVLTAAVGAAVCVALAFASWELVAIEREGGLEIALGVPVWIGQIVMPIGFALLAIRLVLAADRSWRLRALAATGLVVGWLIAQHPLFFEGRSVVPGLLVLLLATVLGGPIFVAIGGAALLLFLADGIPAAAIPVETYRLSVSPTLAAIPLFTLTGFVLAEGRASQRLLDVFRGLVGWIPGGTAVVCAVVCAFFTVFTGGSGVTILALGGLLFQALQEDRYRDRFSLGLLTASGSLGLLLPPALPLILYGIVAEISIEDLFVGGILPGLLLVLLIALWGLREGLVNRARRTPFDGRTAVVAIWRAKWELALPVVILVAIFGGYTTVVEASALAAAYVLFTQIFVHREIGIGRDLARVAGQCTVLVGGVLIILGVAMGLTSWLVDAQVAQRILELVRENISSKLVFLLCLNLFLLVVGCLMDIFSATIVVVPLIVPLGAAFDIHPVHLGIIFIANLELGYLTPPVGLNLFLASYRFERPLLEIYRAAVPMLVILGLGVLLITYVPWLTLGLLELFGRGGG
ncbi:MAG: C4-dicarboxylate ABC transporter permease [Acidobacteria bacterium]|nr:MAG: C4-dicarboxylate ABC transporter permease [Acidobacteriota bacterium]REK08850.1 MAG: C4-dicarboxylate ABC transporter permease [Acidobacteriota bacterium]